MNHPPSRAPLLIAGGATALALVVSATGAEVAAAWCAAMAYLGLAGCAVLAGHDTRPGFRWSLAAGLLLLAVATVYTAEGYAAPLTDAAPPGDFAIPPSGDPAGLSIPPIDRADDVDAGLVASWRRVLADDQSHAASLLPALLAFAVALLFLPRRPRRTAAAAIVAAIPLLLAVLTITDNLVSVSQFPPLIGATVPALLPALAGAALLFLAVQRSARSFWLPAATLTFAAWTAFALTGTAEAWFRVWDAEHPDGVLTAIAVLYTRGGADPLAAFLMAATLAPPAFLAWSALHEAAPPAPADSPPPPATAT